MDTSELFAKTSEMLGGNLVMDWHPIQGGSSDTLSHAEETGISCGSVGHLAPVDYPDDPAGTFIEILI